MTELRRLEGLPVSTTFVAASNTSSSMRASDCQYCLGIHRFAHTCGKCRSPVPLADAPSRSCRRRLSDPSSDVCSSSEGVRRMSLEPAEHVMLPSRCENAIVTSEEFGTTDSTSADLAVGPHAPFAPDPSLVCLSYNSVLQRPTPCHPLFIHCIIVPIPGPNSPYLQRTAVSIGR